MKLNISCQTNEHSQAQGMTLTMLCERLSSVRVSFSRSKSASACPPASPITFPGSEKTGSGDYSGDISGVSRESLEDTDEGFVVGESNRKRPSPRIADHIAYLRGFV